MNIKVNEDWMISSDALNVTLYEKRINNTKTSKNFGKEYWVEQGNYGDLEQAYNGFLKRKSLKSDATSFTELIMEIREIKAFIKESVGGLNIRKLEEKAKRKAK